MTKLIVIIGFVLLSIFGSATASAGIVKGGDGGSIGDYKFENKDLDPDELNVDALSWLRYLQSNQNAKQN